MKWATAMLWSMSFLSIMTLHGHGLAILTPRWLSYILNETTALTIYRLGVKVFGIAKGLDSMEGAKKTMEDGAMAEHACMGGVITGPMELRLADVKKIYEMCM